MSWFSAIEGQRVRWYSVLGDKQEIDLVTIHVLATDPDAAVAQATWRANLVQVWEVVLFKQEEVKP